MPEPADATAAWHAHIRELALRYWAADCAADRLVAGIDTDAAAEAAFLAAWDALQAARTALYAELNAYALRTGWPGPGKEHSMKTDPVSPENSDSDAPAWRYVERAPTPDEHARYDDPNNPVVRVQDGYGPDGTHEISNRTYQAGDEAGW